MGKIKDLVTDVMTIPCDDCGGVGFIFWGNENDYDVEPCDCVATVEDELTLDWINE